MTCPMATGEALDSFSIERLFSETVYVSIAIMEFR